MGILATGTFAAINNVVTVDSLDSDGSIGITITGTWVGTLTFQGSIDGTNYSDMYGMSLSGIFVTNTTSNGSFIFNPAGLKSLRVKATTYTSGTPTAEIRLGGNSAIINTLDTIVGNTDGTKIGNTGDRLKVAAEITGSSGANSSAFTSKTRVVVLTSSVQLSTGSYTNCYTYSGSGLLYGFNVEFNNVSIIVKLQIDGETIFDGVSIGTLNGLLGTGNDAARRQAGTGIVTSSATIDWSLKQPIKYNSNITISADANGGGLLTRSFSQGIIYLSKET